MTSNVLYFAYTDTDDATELWYFNGTDIGAANPVEVTPGLELADAGLIPQYLDAFGSELIFNGADDSGRQRLPGMWISDGEASGTHEVTGIKGANPGGMDPSLFADYKNEVLFDGESGFLGAPVDSLWVTKGTAKSTSQLGGNDNHLIKGANTIDGLLAYCKGFTNFRGLAFFDGYDKAGNIGLWRTNGKVAGTFEIMPITGAVKVGTPGTDIQPAYMAVISSSKMIFAGEDLQDGQYGLWLTNGTAGGTTEIGGQANNRVKNSPAGNRMNPEIGIGPIDITAFKGKAIFAGTDNTIQPNGYYAHSEGLWITNGTVGGTTEIGGHGSSKITDAAAALNGGLLGGIENPDFTVYGNEVLFLGVDHTENPGQMSLWETNGTQSGTTEIGGLGNAGIAEHPVFASNTDNKSPDFTVYDGLVFFTALNSENQWAIWETNGTASGTQMVFSTGPDYLPATDFTHGKLA